MKTTIFCAFSVAALIAGCSDTPVDPPVEMDPVKPALAGTQIERMGRGTINVAVTNPFNLDYSAVGGGANRDATRDMHSKDGNEQNWVTKWRPILAKTLGIYDGVATGGCGNQFGACGMATGCPAGTPMANRYDTLASVLADDRLYLDSTIATCSFYLAVEAALLQVPGANTLCGGRTPLVDVVDETYTAATVGTIGFPNGTTMLTFAVTDGVATQLEPAPSLTVFPFLSAPNP